jgi:mannobiose 2-epimerase
VVNQARLTWVSATVAMADPERKGAFNNYAHHGVRFLLEQFLLPNGSVKVHSGAPQDRKDTEHHAYFLSFVLFAAASVIRAGGDGAEEARRLGKAVLKRFEGAHTDAKDGGFFDVLNSRDEAIVGPVIGELKGESDIIGTPYGLKSQNTHLHILEAFAEWLRVEDSAYARRELQELVEIFLTDFAAENHSADGIWLHQLLQKDRSPAHGHAGSQGRISFGHDVEAGHLVLDAAEVLGDPILIERAKARHIEIVRFNLKWSNDREKGGLYYAGEPPMGSRPAQILNPKKSWWAQVEWLLALSTALQLDVPGDLKLEIRKATESCVNWLEKGQTDEKSGGFFEWVPAEGETHKGRPWKEPYHEARGLLYASRLLAKLGL